MLINFRQISLAHTSLTHNIKKGKKISLIHKSKEKSWACVGRSFSQSSGNFSQYFVEVESHFCLFLFLVFASWSFDLHELGLFVRLFVFENEACSI